jgi:hypothetical protein
MSVFMAPQNIAERDFNKKSIFLAGSIEMGTCYDWQSDVIKKLTIPRNHVGFGAKNEEEGELKFNIFNPRREDWEGSWEQKFDNPNFYQQVEWEITAMDRAHYILMYFDPTTKSPITLLELGLHAQSQKLLVCCPEGFWRRGNVEIVCYAYNIPMYKSIDDMIEFIKNNE